MRLFFRSNFSIFAALALVTSSAILLCGCANDAIDPAPTPVPTGTPLPALGPPVTLEEGLQIEELVLGTGATPATGQRVTVHYTGTLTNGTVFDSSRNRGTPFSFTLGIGQVIPGWDRGLATLKVGGRRRLTIGPALAYGANGYPPSIPGNATLIFDVEMLSIP